jgi:hypothetical protein
MPALRPCPSCSRHVRISEAACPFCAARFDDAFRAEEPRPRAPTARLTRAALFALSTGAAGMTTACGGQVSGPGTQVDASEGDATSAAEGSAAADGGSDASGLLTGNDSGAGADGGSTVTEAHDATYGVPCCGQDADSCCNTVVPYGLPPGL